MNYTNITYPDVNNGPGCRISLFVSGCNIRCKGCFNNKLWSFKNGKEFTVDTLNTILDLMNHDYISGFSLLGGEPLDQDLTIIKNILKTIKETYPQKTIWLYTGHIYEDLNDNQKDVLQYVDVLVDGPFINDLKDASLAFRGSSNQRIINVRR